MILPGYLPLLLFYLLPFPSFASYVTAAGTFSPLSAVSPHCATQSQQRTPRGQFQVFRKARPLQPHRPTSAKASHFQLLISNSQTGFPTSACWLFQGHLFIGLSLRCSRASICPHPNRRQSVAVGSSPPLACTLGFVSLPRHLVLL